MKRFKNILFVADRPGALSPTFERAAALSDANHAQLTVMDVVEPMVWSAENQARFGTDLSIILRDRRLEELADLTAPHCTDQQLIRTQVSIGTPFLEIIRATLRNNFDLVIKSAEQPQGFLKQTLGPNDLHLLRKCPCPVWIDREQSSHPYRRILAAVDPLGDEDKWLARTILDLATSFESRESPEVHVAHAWRLPGESALSSGRFRVPGSRLQVLLQEERDVHAQALSALLGHYDMKLGDTNVHFEKSDAMPMIIKLAQELPADLVVIGTVGRVGIPGFFIGNTAESIIQAINRPVLTVKPSGFVSPVTLP